MPGEYHRRHGERQCLADPEANADIPSVSAGLPGSRKRFRISGFSSKGVPMRIAELYSGGGPVISLEVFPPKPGYPIDTVFETLDGLADLSPAFISVTYGSPAGETHGRTEEVAARIKRDYGIESLAHLTCLSHGREGIARILDRLGRDGIGNILALRGDPPDRQTGARPEFSHAHQLIREVKRRGNFCVGAAAYPEGHSESPTVHGDLDRLKQKVDAGADFLITQMFFDNRVFLDFLHRAGEKGIEVPVVPGIMPVLNFRQIKRIIYLCGVSVPARLLRIFDRFGGNSHDLRKAGMEYAESQIRDLCENGVPGVHLYTMNRTREIRSIISGSGISRMESSA